MLGSIFKKTRVLIMGNEASQEGEEGPPGESGGPPANRGAGLVTQQSMPLPGDQGPPSSTATRRGSIQLLRRASSAGATAPVAPPAQAPPPAVLQAKRGSIVEMPPELDLSNLSEEERATILSVMARAQSMDEETMLREQSPPPPLRRTSVSAPPLEEIRRSEPQVAICPMCHVTELTNETSSQCVECGKNVCRKCCTAIPSGKKHVWMCYSCAENYPGLPQTNRPKATPQERNSAGRKEEAPAERRKSEASINRPNANRQPSLQQQQPQPQAGRPRSGSLTSPQQTPSQDHPQQQQSPQQQKLQQRPAQQHPAQPRPQQPPPQQSPQHPQGMPQRPQHPQQQQQPRAQHPQQMRPQHPQQQQQPPKSQHPPQQQQQQQQPRLQHPQQGPPQPPNQMHDNSHSKPQQHPSKTQGHPIQSSQDHSPQHRPQQQVDPHQQRPQQHQGDHHQQRPQQQQQQQHQGDPHQQRPQQHQGDPHQQRLPQHQGDPHQQRLPQHQGDPHQQKPLQHQGDPHQQRPQPHQGDPHQQRPQHHQGDPQRPDIFPQQQNHQQQVMNDAQQRAQQQQPHPSQPQHRNHVPVPHHQQQHSPQQQQGMIVREKQPDVHHQQMIGPQPRNKHFPPEPATCQQEMPVERPRTGTNPFRSDTNPFRKAADDIQTGLPFEDHAANHFLDNAKLQFQNGGEALNGTIEDIHGKTPENAGKVQDKRFKNQELQENAEHFNSHDGVRSGQRRGSGGDIQKPGDPHANSRDIKGDAELRNANVGLTEAAGRRQLPVIEKNRQKKHFQEQPQPQKGFQQPLQTDEQGTVPPVPRTRTSVQEKPPEPRNGQSSIPRTVPLTSVTLQQQDMPITQQVQPQHPMPPIGHVKQTQEMLQQQIMEQQQKQRFPNQASGSPQQPLKQQQIRQQEADSGRIGPKPQASQNIQNVQEVYLKPDRSQDEVKKSKERESEIYRSFGVIGKDEFLHTNEKVRSNSSRPDRKDDTRHREQNVAQEYDFDKIMMDTNTEKPQDRGGVEEDSDDYFKLIENAIGIRKPQVVLGVKRSSDIQKQLMGKDPSKDLSKKQMQDNSIPRKGHVVTTAKQIDMYNQNQAAEPPSDQQMNNYEKQLANMGKMKETNISEDPRLHKQDKHRGMKKGVYDATEEYDDGYVQLKRDPQYNIPPSSTDLYHQRPLMHDPLAVQDEQMRANLAGKGDKPYTGTPYDKLLMHQLSPDTRQPSAKHYLEEHKTQPLSYEAFSSVKALQQNQRRSSEPSVLDNAPGHPQDPYAHLDHMDKDSQRLSYSLGLIGDNLLAQKQQQQPQQPQASYYYSQLAANQIAAKTSDTQDENQQQQSGKPGVIDLQKKVKIKPDPQDWSPVSDLSPIIDVSPSVEAAEQELMKKFQEKTVHADYEDEIMEDEETKMARGNGQAGGIPRATSGTISGMLEEFTRALGLPGSSPIDDSGIKMAVSPTSLAISPISSMGSATTIAALQKDYQDSFTRGGQGDPGHKPTHPTSGSPQKSSAKDSGQPTTPRRTHRRLPQPTVEQMQAAVAMAAQGPRDRAAAATATQQSNSGILGDATAATTVSEGISSVSLTSSINSMTSSARPVSPMVPWKTSEVNHPLDHATKVQELVAGYTGRDSQFNDQGIPPKPYPRTAPGAGSSQPSAISLTEAISTSSPSTMVSTQDSIQAKKLRSLPYTGDSKVSKLEDGSQRTTLNGSASPSFYVAMNSTGEKVATSEGSPQTPSTPRDKGGDSSDTQSEAESIKSVRLRRKLPSLPQDQRSSPSPTRKNMERKTPPSAADLQEALSTKEGDQMKDILSGSTPSLKSYDDATFSVSPSPGIKETSSLIADYLSSCPSPSRDSRTSSPGLRVETSISGSMRTPSPSLSASESSRPEVVSPSSSKLPQYMQTLKQQLREELKAVTEERKVMLELRKEGGGPPPSRMTTIPSTNRQMSQKRLDDDITIMTTATSTVVSSTASPQIYDPKAQFQPQIRPVPASSTSVQMPQPQVATCIVTGSLTPQSSMSGSLTPAAVALRRQQQLARVSPQASPKKARRRHTSEISVPQFSPMRDEYQQPRTPVMGIHTLEYPPQMYPTRHYIQQRTLQMQPQMKAYNSMEFQELDGHIRPAPGTMMTLRSSNRYGGSLGSGLGPQEYYIDRTCIGMQQSPYYSGYISDDRMEDHRIVGPDVYFQTLNNEISRLRKSSETIHQDPMYGGGMPWGESYASDLRMSPQTTERRKKKEKKIRKPRSWQPSPYVSEDEDDQLTREEKKAKIKAEIARRRQQIDENMRLHDELMKLAKRRHDEPGGMFHARGGGTCQIGYSPSQTELMYPAQRTVVEATQPLRSASSTLGLSSETNNDDTSSVLKAIDEILRKDLYSGPLSRATWATYNQATTPRMNAYNPPTTPQQHHHHQHQQLQQQQQHMNAMSQSAYYTVPRRYEYSSMPDAEANSWYEETTSPNQGTYYQEATAEDESIERIASTFPTDEPPDILLSSTPGPSGPTFHSELSPVTPSDTDTPPDHDATPAMPLLPDMPTRSRKMLENLGSSPIQTSRSGSAQGMYQDRYEGEQMESMEDQHMTQRQMEMQGSLVRPSRKSRGMSKTTQKYDFPVKRILLTRDPKDRSVSGNGLGMKVVGGKEVPGSNGMIGAYVAKIFPGGVVETLGEVKEGDQVLEWNGISLTGRTYEEVQRIIASSADEVEIVIRCDLNMLESLGQLRKSPDIGRSGSRSGLDPSDHHGNNGRLGGNPSPGGQSPYSPAGSSPRGHSPSLTKRMLGDDGGGGGMIHSNGAPHGMVHSTHSGSSLRNSASSYGDNNMASPNMDKQDNGIVEYPPSPADSLRIQDGRPQDVMTLFTSSAGLLHHSFASATDFHDIYHDTSYHGSLHSPDEYVRLREEPQYWGSESHMQGVQVQVSCGPRAAIMYVPIVPVQHLVSVKNNTYVTQPLERTSFSRRSLGHIPDYQSLVKSSNPVWRAAITPEVVPVDGFSQRSLGLGVLNYNLVQSKAKVSLHLNGFREKGFGDLPSLCKLRGKNGIRLNDNVIGEMELRREESGRSSSVSSSNERPRAPQDLPGLRPVFVNEWKRPKKSKEEESDKNNNNSINNNNNDHEVSNSCSNRKNGKNVPVGSSPEASPYTFFPKGCRGSFCVLL